MDVEMETQQKKRKFGGRVFGDRYGMVTTSIMLPPKDVDLVKMVSFVPSPSPIVTTCATGATTTGATRFELGFQAPDFRLAFRNFIRTREVAEFLSGALAGALTKVVVAPLETIRTKMVVGVGSKNISDSFLEVIEQQGWQGLWAGNGINLLHGIPTQALELGTFECVKRAMTSVQEKWNQSESPRVQISPVSLNFSLSWISPVAVAGAAAGVVSTVVCHPLEVLKVARKRLMVGALQGKCPPNVAAALSEIIREEGLLGLHRGWGASCLKVMPSSGITWMFYEACKDILLTEKRCL